MRLEYAKPLDHGVQQLQYVGETEMLSVSGPWYAATALVALLAKKRSTKLAAAAATILLAARALR